MSAWAFRVKGGPEGANWAEAGVSRNHSGRVVIRLGDGGGLRTSRTVLSPEQARMLRRALSRAIRETEAFRASAERGKAHVAAVATLAGNVRTAKGAK